MPVCYLGLGANLGERKANLMTAVSMIRKIKGTRVLKFSRIIETEPVGGPGGQPRFLNAALKVETRLTPGVLLRRLKRIERSMGRKSSLRNGPRLIDLDILLYEGRAAGSRGLVLPHPRMYIRDFVLRPLSEIYESHP